MQPKTSTFFLKFFFISLAITISYLLFRSPAKAINCEGEPPKGNVEQIQEYQKSCEQKISELQGQQKTLSSAITLLNSKVKLTQAQILSTATQIEQLQVEIATLGTVIEDLNKELDKLTTVFVARVRESYKDRDTNPLILFFATKDYNTFQNRLKYLQLAQKRDQVILKELETAKVNFDQQKKLKEEKQIEIELLKASLEKQQVTLKQQQSEKQTLLTQTKNSEKIYQDLLAKAVAELAAIESIIAGNGSEVEVGDVSVNQRIASVIPSASPCSTGAHLHFEVVQNKAHQNPANFLKSKSIVWSNSPDSSFSFSGSWDWPIVEPIRITQGYGHTAYSSRYAGDQHTGIDMISTTNYEVYAARRGKLYRGSVPCGGGTLKYVHVKHAEDSYDTYYLHVNYF